MDNGKYLLRNFYHTVFSFGKHKGEDIFDVYRNDEEYIHFCLEELSFDLEHPATKRFYENIKELIDG